MRLHVVQTRRSSVDPVVRQLVDSPALVARAFVALAFAVCAAGLLFVRDETATTRLIAVTILTTSVAVMSGIRQYRFGLSRRMFAAWGLVAVALTAAGIGTALSTAESAVSAVGLTLAAAGLLLGLVGIVVLVTVSGHRWRSALLDAAIVGAAGFLVVWVVLIDPVLRHIAAHGEPWALAVFPIMITPILAVLVQMALAEERKLPTFWLLVAAMTLSIAGSGIDFAGGTFAYALAAAIAPFLYLSSMALIAAAALHRSMIGPVDASPSRDRAVSRARVVLLALAMLAAQDRP